MSSSSTGRARPSVGAAGTCLRCCPGAAAACRPVTLVGLAAPRAASRRRRRTGRPPEAGTMIPSQTRGEKTRWAAQWVTSSTMSPASCSVPVSQAASGSSVQASAAEPGGEPRRRQGDAVSSRADHRQRQGQRCPGDASRGRPGPASLRGRVWNDRRPDAHHPGSRLRRRRRRAPRAGLAAALAAYAARPRTGATSRGPRRPPGGAPAGARWWLCSARWRSTTPGLAHDKTSDMAAVLMHGTGRPHRAARLHRLRGLERGTPRPGRSRCRASQAARAAIQDGAAALLVDVAGPVCSWSRGRTSAWLAVGTAGTAWDSPWRGGRRTMFRHTHRARLVPLCVTDPARGLHGWI